MGAIAAMGRSCKNLEIPGKLSKHAKIIRQVATGDS